MSCRHDLALSTCKVCYPETGTIQPLVDGDSMDGPGAVARDGTRNPIPLPFHTDTRESDVASQREQKLQDENQALRDQIELLEKTNSDLREQTVTLENLLHMETDCH
jgi:hypothetical protein